MIFSACVLAFFLFRWFKGKYITEIDPITIVGIFFVFPMSLWLQKLSIYQAENLETETKIIVMQALLIWLILPVVFIRRMRARPNSEHVFQEVRQISENFIARNTIYFLSVLHLILYLYSNKVVSGYYFPLFDPEAAFESHAASVPIVQIFTKTNFAFVVLSFIAFYGRRSILGFAIFLSVLCIPLSKLSRADMFFSILVLSIFVWPIFIERNSRIKLVLISLLSIALLWGMSALGENRLNRFGQYDLSYAEIIGYNSYAGPHELFAWLYGFFPLSFENLNNAVLSYKNGYVVDKYHGLISFSPIFNSVFFIKNFVPGYDLPVSYRELVGPMNSAVTVPTALGYFYFDFSEMLTWVPMLFYILIFIILYRYRGIGAGARFSYAVIGATFCLTSFQAFMTSPYIYQGLLIFLLALKFSKRVVLR